MFNGMGELPPGVDVYTARSCAAVNGTWYGYDLPGPRCKTTPATNLL